MDDMSGGNQMKTILFILIDKREIYVFAASFYVTKNECSSKKFLKKETFTILLHIHAVYKYNED